MVESFEENTPTKLYFDKAYPDRMQDKFEEIVLTRPLSLGDRDNPLADLAKQ